MDDQSHSTRLARDDTAAVPWLRLAMAPGIGAPQRRALRECCGDFATLGKKLAVADFQGLPAARELTAALARPSVETGVRDALCWAAAHSMHHILGLDHPDYPPCLRCIDDPPPVLYVRGAPSVLNRSMLAVVGARKASRQGVAFTRQLAAEIAVKRHGIVSGLAYGIDAAAHLGCLEASGCTVAVMATALDRVYPRAHLSLAERIVEKGALVSEFPLGSRLYPGCFPRRNRLISGLAWGVVVVEAAMHSGSLITARHALDQGREVMSVPGMAGQQNKRGCHALLRDGAALVESARDVLDIHASIQDFRPLAPESVALEAEPTEPHTHDDTGIRNLINDQDARSLLNCLTLDCASIDALAERTGWPVGRVSAAITLLEIEGLVLLEAGGLYTRS